MAAEEGYGEQGYTVVGSEHYTTYKRRAAFSRALFFALGCTLGAGIALLLTPQPGRRPGSSCRRRRGDEGQGRFLLRPGARPDGRHVEQGQGAGRGAEALAGRRHRSGQGGIREGKDGKEGPHGLEKDRSKTVRSVFRYLRYGAHCFATAVIYPFGTFVTMRLWPGSSTFASRLPSLVRDAANAPASAP